MRAFLITLLLSGCELLVGVAPGQSVVRTHNPTTPNPGYGSAVGAAGDVDGDGIGDYLIGNAGYAGTGLPVIEVRSGATGDLILGIRYSQQVSGFANTLVGGEDFDQDGTPDFAVSVGGLSSVFVYSGTSGSIIRTHAGQGADGFGSGVYLVGDLTGDGVREYAVSGVCVSH